MKTIKQIEKPMLFSGPMVRALVEGRKTQTRRVVKPQPTQKGFAIGGQGIVEYDESPYWTWRPINGKGKCLGTTESIIRQTILSLTPHPTGSRIWVKETFYDSRKESKRVPVTYRAGLSVDEDLSRDFKWKPSIFMPRWASRITLEVTKVRVERVQDISDQDAMTEGVTIKQDSIIVSHAVGNAVSPAQLEYYALWESINGKGSWSANPWVWVYEFRVLAHGQEVKP